MIKPAVDIKIGNQQKALIDENNIGSYFLYLFNIMKHVSRMIISTGILLISAKHLTR